MLWIRLNRWQTSILSPLIVLLFCTSLELQGNELSKGLHLSTVVRFISQVFDCLQPIEHLPLPVAWYLPTHILIDTLLDLITQVSLQIRVLLLILSLENILNPLNSLPILIDCLRLQEITRRPLAVGRVRLLNGSDISRCSLVAIAYHTVKRLISGEAECALIREKGALRF